MGQPEVQRGQYFGKKFEDRLLELGTKESFTALERSLIKAQVKSFIPPLLQPAVGNSAFVLPPGLWQFATSFRFTNISGDDFFKNGNEDPTTFDKGTRRQFLTASIRYGFDLDMKYLHSFTAVLNIPWQNSESTGAVNLPFGAGGFRVNNGGNAQGLGDISLFLKKKLLDQANENRFFGIPVPLGMAIAVGIFFPSGDNDAQAGDNGRITVNTPAGATNNVVFRRFSDDGRLPSVLQPGTGNVSYQFGLFFTRQFLPGDMPDVLAGTPLDRAAIHWGGAHRLNFEDDGIDPGDLTTLFVVGSIPIYKDFLSLQVNSINFYRQFDSYDGVFCAPNNAVCNPGLGGTAALAPARQSFTQGWTSLFGPGLIYSPDPLIRLTATSLFRIKEPHLGPAPPFVVNFGATMIF